MSHAAQGNQVRVASSGQKTRSLESNDRFKVFSNSQHAAGPSLLPTLNKTFVSRTLLLVLLAPTSVFSQAFTASSLGDFGNVAVMEVSGNYDAERRERF